MKKIVFYMIFAVFLIGFCYLIWLNHQDFKNAMVRQAQSQLLIIAKSQAQSIERYLVGIRRELEILASGYSMHESIKEGYNQSNRPEYYRYLSDSYKDVEKLVDSIYLINAQGIVLNVSPFKSDIVGKDFSKLPDIEFMLASHQAFTSGIFKTSTGRQAIAILYPVFEGKTFLGFLRAVVLIDRVNGLVARINQGAKGYVIVMNSRGVLLSYPDESYIGNNILTLLNSKFPDLDFSEFNTLVRKMMNGEEGTTVLRFLSAGIKPEMAKTLVAFTTLHISNDQWPVAAAMDYEAIAAPINRNTRDNLILAALIALIFLILAHIFYRNQRKRAELQMSSTVINIINKQLRLELDERKRIQKEFQDFLDQRRKKG